jgi:hypothetical protein
MHSPLPNTVHPLVSPLNSLREVCKHLVLLEERLVSSTSPPNAERVRKHFLAIEALLDEGLALSQDPKISILITEVLSRIVYLQQVWGAKGSAQKISTSLREIRSKLSSFCFSSGLPPASFSPSSMGEITVPGRKIWLDILVAGLGIYFGYFLVDKLGTGRTPK